VIQSFLIILFTLFIIRHRFYWKAREDIFIGNKKPIMVAHRGVKVNAPENTILAFMDAVKYGFNGLELDVIQLKDGSVVCSHNFDLERETNSSGWLYEKNISDLKEVKAGIYSHPKNLQSIPKLIDVIKKVPKHVILNIEIKCKSIFDFSTARFVGRMTRKNCISRPYIISCFNPFVVAYLRLFHPQIYVGFLVEDLKLLFLINWIHPDYLHLDAGIANERVFLNCEKHSLSINIWTVNSIPAIKWCLQRDILGIITDNHTIGKVDKI